MYYSYGLYFPSGEYRDVNIGLISQAKAYNTERYWEMVKSGSMLCMPQVTQNCCLSRASFNFPPIRRLKVKLFAEPTLEIIEYIYSNLLN